MVFGPDHPKVAIRLNNLRSVLLKQGDVRGALQYAERALAIWEVMLGSDHPTTQRSRKNVEIARRRLDGAGG